jgi:hypothetical protein
MLTCCAATRQAAALWEKTVEAAMKRCAESLLAMTINWRQLELSDEALPDVANGRTQPPKPLFVDAVLKEFEAASNAQLDRALTTYCERRSSTESGGDSSSSRSVNHGGSVLLSFVIEALLRQMLDDLTWWQQFDSASKDKKRAGCGGVSKFLAEIKTLEQRSVATPQLQDMSEKLTTKLTVVFEQTHAKGAALASRDWIDAYVGLFARPELETADASSLSVS